MIYYIPSREEMINDAHIIRAKFSPARHRPAGIDKDGPYPEKDFPPELTLVTTELDLEENLFYDGGVRSFASKSQNIIIRGSEAEYLWCAMQKQAYGLSVPFVSPNKVLENE